jgi:hypothetical protein
MPGAQFKRENRSPKLRTYLGPVSAMSAGAIAGNDTLEDELSLSRRVLAEDRHQRGHKVYSLHAPEVEWARRTGPTSSASRLRYR